MLSDSHGVEDGAVGALGIETSGGLDVLGSNAGELAHPLGVVGGYQISECFKVLCAFLHKLLVVKLFPDDDVHKTVEQSDVAPAPVPEVHGGVLGQFDAPGVAHQQSLAVLGIFLHP
ncbi:MAG: hypothetical protein BWY79_01224 [Actinobacteria bacterium ADurb.Bin444]|nr:MAG: hypothetical protein BWY79_01224 [Actinobacteria bacterium ADurb.Bin444]